MPKRAATYDTLAFRLTEILKRLNEGGKLEVASLAEEFTVHPRTIQRDLNERFAFLPWDKKGDSYKLDTAYLGKLTLGDMKRFAALAGVRDLFPSLSDDFLRDIFDNRIQSALLVKGHHYEDLRDKAPIFRQLEQAILGNHLIDFAYHKDQGTKNYTAAQPYKLVNHSGIWYLAALDRNTHEGKLKAFSFSKIDRLQVLESTFDHDQTIDQTLKDEDGIWLNPEKTEVVLKIAREAANYFRRRSLIAHQVIEKELEDGGLLVSGKVAHVNQILPIVRYWIPHVRIISPEGLQADMEHQIKAYLEAY
ncbi:helix-turn-helix transcriptional regulator [Candidatus Symbiobacter mobilis]|uniref:Transcriptional regulator n=1 Tax=Candidatus Symbiobacter mobilis CR TaxID=946483 RepID=U5NB85_9BURK|nr:WYL domain-containing protein [Candidatus Symbiobacter mobilis]AGX87498.1 transcriptional regulator [Candidatus Symbiobacter mobilis CR]